MLGFVAAVVAELQTGQSVWSQLAGKYVNGDLQEKAVGLSSLGFGAIVALLTYASIAPQFQAGLLRISPQLQAQTCQCTCSIFLTVKINWTSWACSWHASRSLCMLKGC